MYRRFVPTIRVFNIPQDLQLRLESHQYDTTLFDAGKVNNYNVKYLRILNLR